MSCKCDMKKLKCQMWRVNLLFHATRNNPRNTNRFYHAFIQIAGGYSEWEKIDPMVKTTWESAKLSFDQMYGLVKAWSSTLTEIPKKEEPKADLTRNRIDELENERKIFEKTKEKLKAEKEAVEAEKALDKAKSSSGDDNKGDDNRLSRQSCQSASSSGDDNKGDDNKQECPMQEFTKEVTEIQVTFRKKGE